MNRFIRDNNDIIVRVTTLLLLIAFAFWTKSLDLKLSWQQTGMINFSLAFVLLAAYLTARILKLMGLPEISGYIITGIVAGPFIGRFLTFEMVERLKFIDDLALSFIALAAGGALHKKLLKKRKKAIILNIFLQTIAIFLLVVFFSMGWGYFFPVSPGMKKESFFVFSMLLGAAAIARSPSSAMAIIRECRASGIFTETVLGVTIAIDVLVIVFFTIVMTISKIILTGSGIIDIQVFLVLSFEILFSLVLGAILGKCISTYINRIDRDLPFFLLFIAFGVTKTSLWLSIFMENNFHIHLAVEPLLICISAGFVVQNFSDAGTVFEKTLDRMALPIYVLFFSVAGAALNMQALMACWPFAFFIVTIRIFGIFLGSWISGAICSDPAKNNKSAWMAYMTQAGVAIGLAQLAERQFPEIGILLTTVVLAVISINQIIGPVTFKYVLHHLGEAKALEDTKKLYLNNSK